MLHTLANWELLFQCFDSIQLPSSGNNDKQSGHALIRMVVIHQAHGLVQHTSCLLSKGVGLKRSQLAAHL